MSGCVGYPPNVGKRRLKGPVKDELSPVAGYPRALGRDLPLAAAQGHKGTDASGEKSFGGHIGPRKRPVYAFSRP